MTQQEANWWHPRIHADRRHLLLARNAIAQAVRGYFLARDFVEVDTGAIQISPANQTHIHGLAVDVTGPDGVRASRYLHCSPEFAMKKLLAAGEQRIFSLGHVFRDREQGPLHAVEFTLLEWYRTGEPYDQIIEDGLAILRLALVHAGARELAYRGQRCNPFLAASRSTVAEAFLTHAGIDLMATVSANGSGEAARLADAARAAGIVVAPQDTWSDTFSSVLAERIEPNLGLGVPAVLREYPRPEAALARAKPGDRRLAERFEIYACGVELANGFGELADPVEQRSRFEAEMAEKERVYGESYPLDEDFLRALSLMPEASGAALGFDRLVMLATHCSRIEQVIWTPAA
ncbi:MAG: EF-P lysine aminoacylase EpmA [Pseudomonadota bacterium]|nr:EF-P lysine aminoacylase EpmA [Pseudomonadota bacterium]